MKTMMKSIIAVVVFLTAANLAKATEPVLHLLGDNNFVLSINNLSSDVTIIFTDKNGYSLYNEEVKADKEQFQKKFSVKSLPNGTYQLEIEDELKVVKLVVKIENNKVIKSETANEQFFKPVVYKKGDNIYVNKFSPEKKPMNVVIYNPDNDVVYEETLEGKIDLGRVYSFENSGDYTISLSSNEKTYTHKISINK